MRNIILFGAGAAIPWGGPSTAEVTKILLNEINDDSRHCDSRVFWLLHDFLVYKYRQREGYYRGFVNFEDLINVVEELILYYSDSASLNKDYVHSIFKLSPELENDLSKLYGESKPYDFWMKNLRDVLGTIVSVVSRYSYHNNYSDSEIFRNDEKRGELNSLFKQWAISISEKGSLVRSYTLNYDSLFKELFCWALQQEVLGGTFVGHGEEREFNLKSILKDRDSHCHYNLHGSVYWRVFNKKKTLDLEDWRFTLCKFPYWNPDSFNLPLITVEQGRSFVLSNIVAGYRKTQRTFLAPFKQMLTSFDIDCSDADNLFLIGYSFSDQHINSSIRSYIDENKTLKVHLIDPKYAKMDNTNVLKDILVSNIPQLFDEEQLINGNHNSESYPLSYMNGRLLIYPVCFEEYLTRIRG
jgi:hypothetical protein